MKNDVTYGVQRVFETLPLPGATGTVDASLATIGERYHEHRRALMLRLWLGLTDIYNLFHDRDLTPAEVARVSKKPAEAEPGYQGILQLRTLHRELDEAVLTAYAWAGQVSLGHDFHEVETFPENDRVRYTISPSARKELLRRLLALNHQRAAEETTKAALTLKPAKKARAPKAAKSSALPAPELELGLDIFGNVSIPAASVGVRNWEDDSFRIPANSRHGALAEDLYVRHWLYALFTLQPNGLTGLQIFNSFRLLLAKDARKLIAKSGDTDGNKWNKDFDQSVSLAGCFASLLSRANNREIELRVVDGESRFYRTAQWSESPSEWVQADAEITQRALRDKELSDQIITFIQPDSQVTAFNQALEKVFA